MASRSLQTFSHIMAESAYTLQWAAPFPSKSISHSHEASGVWTGLPSNTWFLGPTRVHNPNGIPIVSAVFAGLTIVTSRQTDR